MSKYIAAIDVSKPNFLGQKNVHWKIQALNDITVILGKNGSGKSILLRTVRDADVQNIHYIVPERAGDISFNPNYMAQQLDSGQRQGWSSRNYVDNYRSGIISRIQGYFISRGASRTSQLKGNPEELEELLSELLSDFAIELLGQNPPYRLIRISDGVPITNVDHLSSGEAQLLAISLDILTISAMWDVEGRSKRIVLIDEPDAHLHPDLQIRFANFVTNVAKKFNVQVIVSTHSTTLLTAFGLFGGEQCSVVFLNRNQNEYKAEVFNEKLRELSAILGGHVLMGPLFAAPLQLVEGDDDYKVWSHVPRHGVLNVAVIPCNGGEELKKYQQVLEKIFRSLSDPKIVGHALLDGDKGLPQPNPNSTQDYIKYIQISCHECENLYLSDETLIDLGLTWDEAKAKILAHKDNFGNKAAKLEAAVALDRKQGDFKAVINEISKIIDPKNVHWTTRLGNRLGRSKPTGQLADFLGPSVLQALWP